MCIYKGEGDCRINPLSHLPETPFNPFSPLCNARLKSGNEGRRELFVRTVLDMCGHIYILKDRGKQLCLSETNRRETDGLNFLP